MPRQPASRPPAAACWESSPAAPALQRGISLSGGSHVAALVRFNKSRLDSDVTSSRPRMCSGIPEATDAMKLHWSLIAPRRLWKIRRHGPCSVCILLQKMLPDMKKAASEMTTPIALSCSSKVDNHGTRFLCSLQQRLFCGHSCCQTCAHSIIL